MRPSYSQRLQTAWQLSKQGIAFFRKNLDLCWIPVVSFVCNMIFLAVIFAMMPALHIHQSQQGTLVTISGIATIVVTLFFSTTLATFFNASLCYIAQQRLSQKPCSLKKGMRHAASRWRALLGWSLLSATVGTVINTLQRSHNLIEKILIGLVGFSWALASYFVTPLLVARDIGPIDALKQSAQWFKQQWRRVLGVNVLMGLLFLIMVACLFLIGALIQTSSHNAMMMIILISIGILLFVTFIVINTTLNTIIKAVMYLYCFDQQTPMGFDSALLQRGLISKKKKQY